MDPAAKDPVPQYAVVVFDGEYSFCNGWIDFLLRLDNNNILRLSSRRSEAGASVASQERVPPPLVGPAPSSS